MADEWARDVAEEKVESAVVFAQAINVTKTFWKWIAGSVRGDSWGVVLWVVGAEGEFDYEADREPEEERCEEVRDPRELLSLLGVKDSHWQDLAHIQDQYKLRPKGWPQITHQGQQAVKQPAVPAKQERRVHVKDR